MIGAFLKRADLPERGLAWVLYIQETKKALRKFVRNYLPAKSDDFSKMVRLVDFSPKDELDLVPGALFELSELSEAEIRHEVAKWPVEKKEEVLQGLYWRALEPAA